ncbi:photosystem II D1 precursor processing protein PSB27-H2, chloroplastic [Euphorbia lathyris]|uniref:photosystem II D1 precursor processing protein PSB27-H2, chloroplastic n=1 Tax=Euphorbia lathyris TaxID=212925 RepID=UPI0033140B92
MAVILAAKMWSFPTCKAKNCKAENQYKQHSRQSNYATLSRRRVLVCSTSFLTIINLNCILTPLLLRAEEKSNEKEENEGIFGAIKTLIDPNEKTKSGKLLPKAYLNTAREVVKTLRESLNEDPKDSAKFRRSADAAKVSIKEYLNNWRGQQQVVGEGSYVELEKVIRLLASFYSMAGPSAPLSEEVKTELLNDLNKAEEFL